MSGKVKKFFDKGNEIKENEKQGNELCYLINYYIEFENNLKKIYEINEKIESYKKYKIKINFECDENRWINQLSILAVFLKLMKMVQVKEL